MSAPLPAAWREALVDYVREQAKPVEKFGHQPRLYALTQLIAQGSRYDDDVVFAAVYLHDLGVFTGHRPEDLGLLKAWDNTAYAVRESPAILGRLGFPQAKIPAVQAAIATHQPQFTPESLEATILRDADLLEQLGAVAILRTVCKVGRDTRFHTFSDAVASLERALDTLPGRILLLTTKALAEARIAALRAFLEATRSEAGDLLL